MSKKKTIEQKDQIDETLLNHYVELKLIHDDFVDLLRVGRFDDTTKEEVVILRDNMAAKISQFLRDYEDFRVKD